MAKGVLKKLAVSLSTVCFAMVLTFFLIRAMPGNPVYTRAKALVSEMNIPFEMAYKIAIDQYNYDPSVPLHRQFFLYVGGLLQGNLGESIKFRIPVSDIIFNALPWTLFIVTLALFTSFLLGCLLGLVLALKRENRVLETFVTFFAVLSQAFPDFLVGLLFLVVFAVRFGLFPLYGAYSIETVPGFNLEFVASLFHHAVLPVAAFTMFTVGGWTLSMKASATSVLTEDYIQVARTKGLTEKRILVRYLGKNAIMPLISGLAVSFGSMISGAMFIESIFIYPGVGYFFGVSIGCRDFVLMQGLLLLTTVAVVIANLFSDFFYAWMDPRVRLE